jgi:DNA gyrase/topoisomerase IV subunit B
MYLGQVNPITAPTWVFNPVDSLMEKQTLTYSPALVKLFDEIIVNAADNRLRGSKMSKIDVQVKYSKRKPLTISVKNDGKTVRLVWTTRMLNKAILVTNYVILLFSRSRLLSIKKKIYTLLSLFLGIC